MLFATGITGHSGRCFVDRLIRENYSGKIRCIVRQNTDVAFLQESGLDIDIVRGNLEDIDILTHSMSGIATLLHIASIDYSHNVIEAAIQNNVKWAILVHTTGRYSKYKSAAAKYIEIEDDILKRRTEIGITVLRPTMIYGSHRDRNMYKLINFLYRHKYFPMFGSGKNLMQPVHARDLGYAYYDVIINSNKTFNKEYNLPGKYPESYLDLVSTVSKALKRNNRIIKLPLTFSLTAVWILNLIKKNAPVSVEQVLRMQEDKAFSYDDAKRDFNYSPISFEEGILEEVAEYFSLLGVHK